MMIMQIIEDVMVLSMTYDGGWRWRRPGGSWTPPLCSLREECSTSSLVRLSPHILTSEIVHICHSLTWWDSRHIFRHLQSRFFSNLWYNGGFHEQDSKLKLMIMLRGHFVLCMLCMLYNDVFMMLCVSINILSYIAIVLFWTWILSYWWISWSRALFHITFRLFSVL